MVDKNQQIIDSTLDQEYKYGFTTDIEQTTFEPGLNEEVITKLSKLKKEPQWLLDWRLKAYESWKKMEEPPKYYTDYTTYKRRFEQMRPLFKVLAEANLVPRSF